MDPSILTSLRPVFNYGDRIRAEEEIGLKSGFGSGRKPRVIVPFWGGADDRAAVELCRKMAAGGAVDGLVIAMPDSEGSNIVPGAQQSSSDENAAAQSKAEEENQETINLRE